MNTDARLPQAPAYRRILVPFDGSESAARALEEAVAIAGMTHASLRLLAVFDPLKHVNGFEPGAVIVLDEIESARARLAGLLARSLADLRTRVPQADSHVVDGDGVDLPWLVAAEAASWGADLVVVGTRGLRGIDRLMLGSVAEDIVRRSDVPVMLVRTAATGKRAEGS